MKTALVIGGGPAGLMAAETLAAAGVAVTLCEAKTSVGRKFLMAGKSGLNLTKDVGLDALLPKYTEAASPMQAMLRDFDSEAVQAWARGLGQEVFTGSTGRVFPKAMKASPLLRAWLARLTAAGVRIRTRMRWQGWERERALFRGPDGPEELAADIIILALGGASWARLGSDGFWTELLASEGVGLAPFAPANVGIEVDWSAHMQAHFGAALKGIGLRAGPLTSRGEAVVAQTGLEGGGLYEVSRALRDGHPLVLDLLPDLTVDQVAKRLERPQRKMSLSNHLRKSLRLDPVKIALAQEFARPLPADPQDLACQLKALNVAHRALRPMDQAISVAGGVRFDALTEGLMLKARPGIFCAGEMLDWEAPTGGYLITGCLASGRWAGLAALGYLEKVA